MDIRAVGEQRHGLDQNLLQRRDRLVGAQANLPGRSRRQRFAVGSQATGLWQHRRRLRRVARHFYLRHNRDMEALGPLHDLAHVARGVIAHRLRRAAALEAQRLDQARIFRDGEAPDLVVHQVPLEDVDLHHCQSIKQVQDGALGDEVAGAVQQVSAPAEARCVLDAHAGQLILRLALNRTKRQQLAKRLHPVEQPGALRRADAYTFRGDLQRVAFVAEADASAIQAEGNSALAHGRLRFRANACLEPRRARYVSRKHLAGIHLRLRDPDHRLRPQDKTAFEPGEPAGQRDQDRRRGWGRRPGEAGHQQASQCGDEIRVSSA